MIFGTSSDSSSILPKTTLIEGAPGIGKTVVAKLIARRWAQNTMLPNIKLLLLIYLKKADINQIKDFEELMQVCYENKDLASRCANYFVKTKGKSLMIIFDGYDEMATEEQKKDDTFFIKLLNRVSLPECHLVVTSRPYITAHLHRYCDCRVEIMGFTKNDRLRHFEENLSYKEFQNVIEFLQKNPIIDSFCYIPLHLINFVSLVKYDIQLPKTQTELTGNTIRLTIARNKKKESGKLSVSVLQDKGIDKIIASIAGFAYKMLDKEQFVFSEEEMKSTGANMEDINDAYGLLKAVQLNDVVNVLHPKVYNFVHFSVQEYLAAYHLSKMYNIAQSFALNHKFWDGKYLGVWRMYAGLTKGDNFPFKAFLSHEWYITAGIRHLGGFKFPGIAEELKKNKVFCLQLYQIFLEAPDSKIKESFSTVVKNDTIDLSEENLSITDTNILSHFIAKSSTTKKWQTINLSKCGIDDDKFQSFYQGLCIEDGREKPIINNLNISNNNIWKLNKIFGLIAKFKIVHLNVSNNSLIYKSATLNVAYFSKTLKFLDLSSNLFESEDVYNLCKGLVKCKNLEELYLNNNNIDESAESSLVEAIFQWDNLKKFKCEYNSFSNPRYTNSLFEFTVKHLKCINNSEEKEALNFSEETENITYFISVLAYTKHLSEENSKYISCISQLRRLSLQCAESEHIPLTTNASIFFQKHFKILEAINLSGLIINEESAHNLLAALSNKLQYLKMNDCKLTSKVAKLIAHKIKIIRSIKELQLCNNHIDDEATKELLIAFLHCNSFERFKFEGNKFEDKSKSLFKFLLSHLNFSGSSLSNLDDVTSFITLLEYMKEVPTVKSVLVENVSKVHHLNLSMNFVDHQLTDTQLELTIVSSQGFEIFHNLMSLNISGIIISENTTSCLVKAFGNNLQLEQLFMNKCQITSPTIIVFCQQLKFNFLKVFELAENCIDDEATEELAIAILHWNLLEYIKLGKNRFTSQGMLLLEMLTKDLESEVIINFINNHYIVKSFVEVLDYTSNNTGERVNQFLSNLIKVTKISLQVETALELTFNASIILQKLRNMTSLNISGIIITEQVANNLCSFFDNNQKSLKQLIMNGCRLNSKKILNFVHELRFTNELMEAEFCENEIDDDATKPLVIAILHWNVLKTLRLENNCFTEISKGLFEILKEFSNSTSVSIDYNDKVNRIIPFITLLGYTIETDIKNSKFVQNISKVEKLLLDCSNQNNGNVQSIVNASKFFTRFVNLTDLNISGMVICKEVANNLAKAFDSNLHSLECLIMNSCQVTSAIAFILIIKLRKCLRMRELQLCNNFIDDDVTQVLVISIFQWNYFKVFEFEGNQFNKESKSLFQFLLSHLKFSDFSLNLSGNFDHLTSFITLLQYMKDVPTNTSRYVDNISKIGCLGLNCLKRQTSLELTFQVFNDLILLNISGIIISENTASCLVKAFSNNLQLERLFMNKCQITSPTINVFCQQLKFNSLKVFELNENCIDDEATEPLAIAILHWNLLEHIELEKNQFTYQGMLLLEMLTKDLGSEVTINFINNHYVVKSFIKLLDYANDNSSKGVKQFLNNLMKVTKISLQVETPLEMTLNASITLRQLQSITLFDINGILINEQVANNICALFDNNQKSLRNLLINNCSLSSNTIMEFGHKLKTTTNMIEAQFCGNKIDDFSTKYLVIAILYWNNLETLKLENNCFKENSIEMFEILKDFLKCLNTCPLIDYNGKVNKIIPFITLLGYMMDVDVKDSILVENVSKVKNLQLDCSNQYNNNVQFEVNASMFFRRFINLTHLDISGIAIKKEVADNLAKAFDFNLYSLEHLIMNKCQLTSADTLDLFKKLKNCLKLKELQLCSNYLDNEATEALAVSILLLNALETLKVDQNCFSEKYEKTLTFLTNNLKFFGSVINFNDMDSIIAFITLLEYMQTISVNVSDFVDNVSNVKRLSIVYIPDEKLELSPEASQFFERFNLTKLNINGLIIKEGVVDNLLKAFGADLQSLEYLFMNNCNLSSRIVIKLMQKLQNAKNIKKLDLCNNNIDDDATKSLVMAILHWNFLECVIIDNNYFKENSIEMFEILKDFLKCLNTCPLIDYNGKVNIIIPFITLLGYMMDVDVKDSVLVENVSKVKNLQLDCSNQYNNNVQFEINASMFFRRFINLTHLDISGIIIIKKVADNLAEALDVNLCSLEHLIMNECQLTSTDTLDLFKKLKKCLKLKELQLCNNYLDNEATEALAVSILHLNALETLKVGLNCFSEKYEKTLTFLTNNLKFLDSVINFNDMDSIIAFITLLEYMQTISVNVSDFVDNVSKVKYLSLIYISDEKLELSPEASQFFERFNLTKLNISGLIIKEGVVDNLLKAFGADLQSLEYLFMNNCNLSSRIVIKLMQKLQNAKNIKELDLCNNCINDEATEQLSKAILHWNLLDYIQLGKNQFTYQGMLLLEMLTKHLESEVIIDFLNNDYVVKSFIEVLDYTSNNTGERVNQFLSNLVKVTKISLQVETALELTFNASITLQKLRNMTSLNISGIIITEQVANNLCSFFANNKRSLKQLIMNGCKLNSKKILSFVHKLRLTNELMEAEFCENEIDDDVTKHLVIAILHWNVLKTLRLENNCFTEISKGLFEILKEFSNSTSAYIDYNDKVDKVIPFITLLRYIMEADIENSKFVENVSKVEKLLLDCSNHNNSNVQSIVNASKFFTRFVNLTDLNISGMVICQEVADNLAKAFDSNLRSLECLIMNNCQLTSAIAFILIIKLRKCLRMRELQLCNNFLDDDVTQVLVISIFQWNYFKVFKFEGNQFNKESKSLFQFLLSHLKFSDLSLNLSGNLDRLTSFITLLGYMKDIPTNASCYIDNISKVGCLGLDCLEQQTSLELTVNSSEGFQIFNHLISLNISGVIISENTASCLVKAFSNNLQLERLFMNKCQITSPTINVFCQQLKFNSLKVFELAENFIDDEATEALAIAILHWNLLEHIELEKNWLSIQSMLLLEMLTKDFKSEVIIDFMNNHDYVVKSFIKVLDYANNNSSKGVKQFLDNLMKVTKISLKVETPLDPQELILECLDIIDKPRVFTKNICLSCKQLRRLKLNGIYFTSSTTITILADCLTYCFPLLQELILTNCNIDSNSIVRLFSYEQRPPITFRELTNLDLSNNFIDKDAMNSLVNSILQMPKLTTFNANGNQVGNYLNTIFRIILDWKSAKSSVKFCKTSNVDGIDHISAFFAILSSAKDISRNNSCQINNIIKINKLVLKNLHYKVPLLNKDASYFITRFTTLQELNLTGVCIEQSVASIINNALTNDLVSLQVLVLCKSMLDSNSAKTLLLSSQTAVPVAFNTLREIDLSYNYITDEIIEILISSFIQMPNLIKLNLDNNQLSKFDMKAIFDIIFEFKTVSPTVYKNDHTSVNSFIIMLSSMKKFTTEHIIQVRNISKIEKLTLQSIKRVRLHKNTSVFFQRLTKLSVLRLFGIYFEPQSIAILSGALAYNLYSLEELMLSNCKLDSKSAVTLLSTDQEAIPVCFGKLRIIDFSCNLIDDDALKPLVNSFLLIPNLQKPHLYGNKFTNIMPILGILYEWINYKTSEINYSNRHDTRAYTSAFFTLVSCIEHATLERSFVKNITTVSSLTLANKHLDHPIVLTKDIAIFFQKFTNLTELSLSGIHIHPKAMKNLAYTLQSNPGLLKLKLNRCQLDSDLVKTMFYSGGRSIALMNLKELDLSYNNIDNKATSILIKSLIQMPKLAYLSITGNKFNRSGERALHNVLSEFSTYKLSINYNNANNSMECVEAFLILLSAINDISKTTFNQIHNITQVRKLYLHCKESLELSKEASLFFGNFFKLTTLSLSGICITTNVAKNLAKVLQNNHDFLQILVLNQCKLDSESVLNLFTATQMSETVITFHSLSTLDLSNNNIKNDAAYPLITLFLQMPKLTELNVDGNYFSEETFITLEFMFAFNKSINIIDSTNPTICRYRPKNISNSVFKKLRGKTYYGKLLHYDYSFINLYCMYHRTTVNYKPSVYALAFIDLLECAKNGKSIQVKNILKLEKLIFNHVQWKNTATLSKDAFTFLTFLSNLKELNLTGVSVDTKDVMVNKFSSLQKLTLADCHLSSEATITILSLLNKCTVTDLCLSHNQITCKVGNAIKTFVDKNNILIDIDLSYNEFKDEGATIIVQSLHTCSHLKRLNLNHNGLTDEFTYQLVTSLLKMPNCVEMDINGNNFNKRIDTKAITDIIMDCKKFQPVVKYDNKSQDYVNAFIILIGCIQNNSQEIFSQSKNISTAQKLCLQHRFQCGFSCELTKEASIFFKKFSNLNEMKLNGITINIAAGKILAETIAISLPSLQILELSHGLLDSDSAIVIASALKKRQIRELCFSHNNINHKAASALKCFLENNDTLIKFDISHNFIGTEGIEVISQSFVSCKSLKSLNLSYNGITDEATVSLVSSLVQMLNLPEVGYHGNDYDIAQVLNIITELKTTKNSIAYHNDEEVSAFLKLLTCVKDVPTENSPQVKNLRKIGNLYLKTSSSNQPINKTAALVIKQFTTLTTLSFDGITIALGIAEIMADALSSNLNCLQYLRLCNCQLDSNLIITLLPSNKPSVPEAYKVLKEIDLSNNNICDKAIVPLAASLLQMCQLEKLTFDNNQVKKYNINTTFKIILECKVTKHAIEYFNNKKDSVNYVASFLALLSSAKNISLEASQQVKNLMNLSKLSLCCTDECVLIEESSFFFERFTALQTLHLYGITIQLQAVTVFAKALALNLHSLEELTLSACGLTSETANEIISSLRKEKLKVLCLSHNAIDDHACKMINDFVVNNNVLTEINISHNNLTTKGSVTLTEGLINCRILEKLDLSYNKITDDATESLHKLMKQFYEYGNFKTLQIDNNYLSQQSIKKVQSAVSWSMCTIY